MQRLLTLPPLPTPGGGPDHGQVSGLDAAGAEDAAAAGGPLGDGAGSHAAQLGTAVQGGALHTAQGESNRRTVMKHNTADGKL